MAINKVVYGSNTLIDLTDTTAVAADVAAGKYFYAADGTKTLGTGETEASGGAIYQDENGFLVLSDEAGGGGIAIDDIASNTEPSGAITVGVSTIAAYSFAAKPITSVSGASVTDLKNCAFINCSSLKTVSFPNLVSVTGTYIFEYCAGLELAHFPNLTTTPANSYMFYKLVSSISNAKAVIVMPKISSLGSRTFDRVFADTIDLGPDLEVLNADMFYNNVEGQTVKTLILRRTSGIVTTSNTDRIKGLRDVYVPEDLIATYEAASNWSTRVAAGYIMFHAIEGSVYETAYADGTPIAA